MKVSEKQKPVRTIPDGVWEASPSKRQKSKEKNNMAPSTDLQGNGYPTNKQGD